MLIFNVQKRQFRMVQPQKKSHIFYDRKETQRKKRDTIHKNDLDVYEFYISIMLTLTIHFWRRKICGHYIPGHDFRDSQEWKECLKKCHIKMNG